MVKKKKAAAPVRTSLLRRIYKGRVRYMLLLPFLIFVAVFKYVPMYGVVLAFKDYKIRKGILGSPWAGFKYFEQLFSALSFKEVLANTLIINLMELILYFPVPIMMALFINEIRNQRMKKTFQTISYLPHFISWVVLAPILKDVLALNGPINTIIEKLGGTSIYFMADTGWFRWILLLSSTWKGCGWGAILYLAAITGINQELYEAAELDGANKFRQIWHITLPGIRPTIVITLIMKMGDFMSAGFGQIYNMYSPAVYKVADVLDTYTYRQGIEAHNYSYATAAGLFQNVVGFVLVILANYICNKLSDGEEGLW